MSDDTYIPLKDREAWADIVPIPQDDGPNPVMPIMYSDEYRDSMDYFRAVSAADEKTERVLDLTYSIIRMCPAHYTVWQYRLATLIALQKDLKDELELMNTFARENLKSYQVWHHRLLLMTNISPEDPTEEIEFIHESLLPDPKNYHTWAYLHWLYCHFSELGRIPEERWEEELAWCERMLADDGRNNSAWGWRWFLRMGRPGAAAKDNADDEIAYALSEIHRIPHNASAWNYLRGVIRATSAARAPLLPALAPYMAGAAVSVPVADGALSAWPTRTREIEKDDTPTPVPLALEFLGDTLAEGGRLGDAAAVFGQLASYADRMRAAYWEMRRSECVNA